jgi:hypothetical protein
MRKVNSAVDVQKIMPAAVKPEHSRIAAIDVLNGVGTQLNCMRPKTNYHLNVNLGLTSGFYCHIIIFTDKAPQALPYG